VQTFHENEKNGKKAKILNLEAIRMLSPIF